MSILKKYYKPDVEPYHYIDKKFKGTDEEFKILLKTSTTLYVGDLNPIVKEECVWELFSLIGPLKRIIMGINKNDKRPCGFCFVEYYNRNDAEKAVIFANGLKFEGKYLKCDIDHGFAAGREYGRGERGGQVKDDIKRRKIFNPQPRQPYKRRY